MAVYLYSNLIQFILILSYTFICLGKWLAESLNVRLTMA